MEVKQTMVFLGGTCSGSTWRDELTSLLTVSYSNPVVDEWDEVSYKKELEIRKLARYNLYVITPQAEGFYSIAELVDDSHKRPSRTIACFLQEYDDERFDKHAWMSLKATELLVSENGVRVFKTLKEVADFLNSKNIN